MVPPVRERRPPAGRVACRLGTPTSGRHSGPQGRGGEDPNRRDGSRLGTYPQQMRRRGQVRDRRPPVGSARGRRARGAVLLSAMAQIGPRITAQIRGVQDCAIRATGDSPLAALTGRVPTGGRRSKPSPRFGSVGGTQFARLRRAVPTGGRRSRACASLRLVAWAPCAMFSVRVAPSSRAGSGLRGCQQLVVKPKRRSPGFRHRLLARISHTHGPERTPRHRNLLTGMPVTRNARALIDVTGCGWGTPTSHRLP